MNVYTPKYKVLPNLIFREEWISDDWFFVSESEIYGNNKFYHQLKKELRIRKT